MQNEENQEQNEQAEVMRFSLVLKSVPVILVEEDETELHYTLTEVEGRKRDQFLDGVNKRLKYQGGEAVGVQNFEGLQASLISLCLLDSEGRRVDAAKIQKYPSTVNSALFKKAKELNGLTDEDSLKAKNV